MYILLAGTASDAHTWNLSVVEEVIIETGHTLRALGSPTAPALVAEEIATSMPDLVVIGTTNGHGGADALRLIQTLGAGGRRLPPIVCGGRLTTDLDDEPAAAQALLDAGYASVFIGTEALTNFARWLRELRAQAVEPSLARTRDG
jgi:methylaspartate mutase sigma subunit